MIALLWFALAILASPFKSKCRVGEDVSILTPHSPGRADF
jgi:hypothetical protein